MDSIKRLAANIELFSNTAEMQEKLTNQEQQVTEVVSGISNIQDAIEVSNTPKFSDLFTGPDVVLQKNLFSVAIQTPIASAPPQPPSNIQQLVQRFENLKSEKQALVSKIIDTSQQIQAAEMALAQSPSPEKAQRLIDLQRQLEELKNQLASVDLQIKELLEEIDKLQAQENQTVDSVNALSEPEQSILQSLLKAAEEYREMLQAAQLFP